MMEFSFWFLFRAFIFVCIASLGMAMESSKSQIC